MHRALSSAISLFPSLFSLHANDHETARTPPGRLYPLDSGFPKTGDPVPRRYAAAGRSGGVSLGGVRDGRPLPQREDRRRGRRRGARLHLRRRRGAGVGVGLAPIRKPGKLPFHVESVSYDLEYGADVLEIHTDAIAPKARVLVVDDLLATGGTVEACCRLVEKLGGIVVGCSFLIELAGLHGARRIAKYKTVSLVKYE